MLQTWLAAFHIGTQNLVALPLNRNDETLRRCHLGNDRCLGASRPVFSTRVSIYGGQSDGAFTMEEQCQAQCPHQMEECGAFDTPHGGRLYQLGPGPTKELWVQQEMGSVALQCSRHSVCPVLALEHHGIRRKVTRNRNHINSSAAVSLLANELKPKV